MNDVHVCVKCRNSFPLTPEFFYRNANTRLGFDTRCRDCARALAADRYLHKSEQINAKQRDRRKTDPDYRAKLVEQDKLKYAKHRDEILPREKLRKAELRKDQNYVSRYRSQRNARFAKAYAEPDQKTIILAQGKRYRKSNPEKIRELANAFRKSELGKAYLQRPDVKARYAAKAMARIAQQIRATPPWADLAEIRKIYILAAEISQATGVPHHVDHIMPLKHPKLCGLHVSWNLQVLPAVVNIRKSNKVVLD
jgi:hypothetical protein